MMAAVGKAKPSAVPRYGAVQGVARMVAKPLKNIRLAFARAPTDQPGGGRGREHNLENTKEIERETSTTALSSRRNTG